jgi:hypothetical protein
MLAVKSGSMVMTNLLNLIAGGLIMLFQVCWLIYGNTFHFSPASYVCRESSPAGYGLWVIMMIILAYGYLIFFGFCIILACVPCLICMLCVAGRAG